MIKRKTLTAFVLALSLGIAGNASAGVMCTDPVIIGAFTNTIGCELGSTNNDFISDPLQVNIDTMFGHTDWMLLFKDEAPDQTGSLEGVPPFADMGFESVMFVLKGGNGRAINPNVYVGYLLNPAGGDYDWSSPFRNGDRVADISHMSIYVRLATEVPEPGVLVLLGAGLLGFAIKRRC